jgi:hypothetical protein
MRMQNSWDFAKQHNGGGGCEKDLYKGDTFSNHLYTKQAEHNK